MSGGSMNYICYQVEEAARLTADLEIRALLVDLAKLLHDEEWEQSGDYGEGAYRMALAAFKQKWFHGDRNERLKGYIDEEIESCRKTLYELIGVVEAE